MQLFPSSAAAAEASVLRNLLIFQTLACEKFLLKVTVQQQQQTGSRYRERGGEDGRRCHSSEDQTLTFFT